MKTSEKGISLIKKHEGLILRAYDDFQPNINITSFNQVRGTLTIGYGHTSSVYVGQKISEQKAEELLKLDLKWAEKVVNDAIEKAKIKISQDRFDALVSWIFNTGNGKYPIETRSAYKALLELIEAERKFNTLYLKYYITSKGKVLPGLVKRRSDELKLLNKN